MKIGESFSPFWRNFVVILWTIALGLTFLSAISVLWGWLVVGPVSCAVLLALAVDDRKEIRSSLSTSGMTADKLLAIYILTIAMLASVVNVAVFSIKLMSTLT